jgi:RNA polymerase sigma-70 factor, ECF subfamily
LRTGKTAGRRLIVSSGVTAKLEATDEAELLRRVARGDRPAFDAFYARTAPWLLARLRRRCADADVVADVLQDTYLAVWRAAGSFAGESAGGSALGWLWTVAAHRLVDALRRRARTAREAEGAVAAAGAVPVAAAAPAAEEEALAGSLGHDLERALAALAPELRQVVQTLVLDGLTVREAAVLLGMPEGTVKTRARRARTALREALS